MTTYKYSIYVPKRRNDGKVTGVLAARAHVEKEICALAGGCTTVDSWGNWIDPNGNLFSEPVWMIHTYTCEDKIGDLFRKLALYVKRELEQESVLVTVEPVISVNFV